VVDSNSDCLTGNTGGDEEVVRGIAGRTHQGQGIRVKPPMDTNEHKLIFPDLVGFIRHVHEELSVQAGRAVNLILTLRNWLIGFYIAEYEQKGTDRAEYGARLLENLSSRLGETDMDNGLFVSKYQLELPKKEEMQRFIEEKVRETVDFHK
jgi:hypothetical protein